MPDKRREGSLEAPTRHALDWQSDEFYSEEPLFDELERVFDVCHGCRRCFNLCNTFPTLFNAIDESETMELDGVPKEVYWDVVDQCYLCDMCYMSKCPYVPPHVLNIDFPHLMLRAKAARFKKQGASVRDKVMAHKRDRRLDLGTNAALYFEDRLTMQYQVQEMLRIERIFEAGAINEELLVYNPLIPDGSNWKATFMIEFPEAEERRVMLGRLIGIEDMVYIHVVDFDRVYAIADEDMERADDEKTSAVHFLRFELPAQQVAALKSGAAFVAGIDHENYQVEVRNVADNIRESLLNDLD